LSHRENRLLVLVVLSLILGSPYLLMLPPGTGEDIPVVAYIENAEPEIIAVDILDSSMSPTSCVDPGSPYFVDIQARDNNTLADIASLEAVFYSPQSSFGDVDDEQHHYTFTWNTSGFHNPSGVGSLGSGCYGPNDPTLGTGTWRFEIELTKKALESTSWTLLVQIRDEANLSELPTTFEVTGFISLTIDASEITFSGSPSETVQSDQNPILLNYSTNQEGGISCYCTDFVGATDPNLVIPASNFMIDDDPDPFEDVETGRAVLTLSQSRQDICDPLEPGSGTRNAYVFITIPEPFLDQDYIGTFAFEMHS